MFVARGELSVADAWEAMADTLEAQACVLRAHARAARNAEGAAALPALTLVSLAVASERFGISVRQLRAAIKDGRLPARQAGRRGYLVNPDEVLRLTEKHAAPRSEPTSAADARAQINRLLEGGRLHVVKRE